jgi:hypothetical protein
MYADNALSGLKIVNNRILRVLAVLLGVAVQLVASTWASVILVIIVAVALADAARESVSRHPKCLVTHYKCLVTNY